MSTKLLGIKDIIWNACLNIPGIDSKEVWNRYGYIQVIINKMVDESPEAAYKYIERYYRRGLYSHRDFSIGRRVLYEFSDYGEEEDPFPDIVID